MIRKDAKQNGFVPGLSAFNASVKIEQEKKMKAKSTSKDTKNRQYVKEKILEYMEQGKDIEKALDIIMKDEVSKKFEYLTKQNIDVRECFKDWALRYKKAKEQHGDFRIK